jgi:hypothetical protein
MTSHNNLALTYQDDCGRTLIARICVHAANLPISLATAPNGG